MWLIKASLRNPYMVATLVFMLIVLGAISLYHIPRDILPVFKAPAVEVLTYYQGMPAASIEKTITNRIERWVNQAPGAALVESKSVPGVSVIKVYFRDEVDPNAALTMTNSLALGTLPTLPPNTLPPVVLPFDPTGTLPLGLLTVSNKNMGEASVKDLARVDVRNMLGAVPGSVNPVVVGGKDRTVLVYLDPKKLESRNISPLSVVEALHAGNMMVTPGTAYFGDSQILLDTNIMVNRVDELNMLPIASRPDKNIYLQDIGHAEDSYAIQTSRVRISSESNKWKGKQQVYVPIYRQGGASTLDVSNGVREYLPHMKDRLPVGTELKFVMDQSIYVKQAIESLIHEGLIGAALVSVMILVFLANWRMTFIASMSIPLALLGAIIGLYLTGNTINAMTLGGLALAIGPLVDDAIVELENNHRNYSMGKSRIRAALDGCAEVMIPVLVATCTTNIVLAPIAMMPGMGGFLFRPLALAVTFSMVTSFVLSRTFVPMMCAKFLPDEHRPHLHGAGGEAHGSAAHGAESPGSAGHGEAHDPDLEPSFSAMVFQIVMAASSLAGAVALGMMGGILAGNSGAALGIVAGCVLGGLASLFIVWRSGRLVPRLMFALAVVTFTLFFSGAVTNLQADNAPSLLEQLVRVGIAGAISAAATSVATWTGRFILSSSRHTERFINLATRRYEAFLALALQHRFKVMAAIGVLFLASLCLTFGIGREFFPQIDAGQITLYLRAPSELRLDATERRVIEVERFIEKIIPADEREMIVSEIGLDPDWSAAYTANSGQQDAAIRIQLTEERSRSSQAYAKLLRHEFLKNPKFSDLRVSFDTGGMVSMALNYGVSTPIDITIDGGTPEQGWRVAEEIKKLVSTIRGAVDVQVVQRRDAPYQVIDVDRQKAASVGLTARDVILQVVAAMNSSISIDRNFWIDTKTGNQYFVAVQYPENPNMRMENMLNVFAITPQKNQPVKLSSLATVAPRAGAVEIHHTSGYRIYNVRVNVEDRDLGGVAGDIEKKLRSVKLPERMHVKLSGEYARMNESFRHLISGLALAAVLVYLLLVALFRSWVGPFIIMFTVPLGLIGVLAMLFVTRTTLNVQSEMGVIFLVGIAVNNGVLLVEFANQQRKKGADVHKSISTAAAIRFRPIMMTFLATFLDLVPMAYGMGKGSEANVPLARAVVGGLLTSTLLTLFVVPIMFTLLMKEGDAQEVDIESELEDLPETSAAHAPHSSAISTTRLDAGPA